MSFHTSTFEQKQQQLGTPPQLTEKPHQQQVPKTSSSSMPSSVYSSSAESCYYGITYPSNAAIPFHATRNEVSPPLTPTVSPSSFALDSTQFNQKQHQSKYSVDVGPFSLSRFQKSMNDTGPYRQIPSYSALLPMRGCSDQQHLFHPQPTTMNFPGILNNNSANESSSSPMPATKTILVGKNKSSDRRGCSKSSNSSSAAAATEAAAAKGHKHMCKYAFCGWSFKRYEHLKRHMLVHTGERPHVCQFPGCGKSFSRPDNFHAHCRTHTRKALPSFSYSSSYDQYKNTEQKNALADLSTSVQHQHQYESDCDGQKIGPYTAAVPLSMPESPYESDHHMAHSSDSILFAPSSFLTLDGSASQAVFGHHQEPTAVSASAFDFPHHPSYYYPQYTINISPIGSSEAVSKGNTASQYPSMADATASTSTSTFSPSSEPASGSSTRSTKIFQSPQRPAPHKDSSSDQHKSHMCPVTQCQRRFKRLEHLKRHMRIHTLERPFACIYPSCHKIFSRSDNLSQHMKAHQRHEDRLLQQQQQQQHHYHPYFNATASSVDNC